MARRVTSTKLDSRTARRSINQGKVTHWSPVSRGRAIGYRRGRRGGAWIARFDAAGRRKEEKLGEADDVLDADGVQILDFEQALDKANKFFHSQLSRATGKTIGPYTVAAAVEAYLKHLKDREAPDLQGATYDFGRNVLPQLGAIEISKLTKEKLTAWREALASRRRLSKRKPRKNDPPNESPKIMTPLEIRRRKSSTNRTLRRLKAALNYAVNEEKVSAESARAWRISPFPNVDDARPNFLSESQQQSFIKACAREKHFQDLVLAALHTGCRYSELARLRVKDFVAAGPSVFVEKTKAKKTRHIFLDKDGTDFFAALVRNRPADDILLVRADGTAWAKDDVKKPLRRALKAAGMTGIQFHSLRHSFATRMLTQGVSMQVAAKTLGHVNVHMIEKHYGHLTDPHLREVMSALPSAGLNAAAKAKRGSITTLPVKAKAR
jgi:integrase